MWLENIYVPKQYQVGSIKDGIIMMNRMVICTKEGSIY